MLSKYDIAMMTDGQREILYVGMKMERDRIVSSIRKMGEVWESVVIQELVDELENK